MKKTSRVLLILASLLALAAPARQGHAQETVPAEQRADFVLLVTVKIKPDQIEAFKQAIVPYAEQTRAEPGTWKYLVHQSVDEPTVFEIVEHYASQEARDFHLAQDHTQRFFAVARPLFEDGYPQRRRALPVE